MSDIVFKVAIDVAHPEFHKPPGDDGLNLYKELVIGLLDEMIENALLDSGFDVAVAITYLGSEL